MLQSSAAVPSLALEVSENKITKPVKQKETHRFRIIKDGQGRYIPQERFGIFWLDLYESALRAEVYFWFGQWMYSCLTRDKRIETARGTIRIRKEQLDAKQAYKDLKKNKGFVVEKIQ